jgi:hypothetical protein
MPKLLPESSWNRLNDSILSIGDHEHSARGHVPGNCGGWIGGVQRFRTDSTNCLSGSQRLSSNYRGTLVTFLRQSLTDRSDFHGVMIAEPALKPVGPSQHYIVCVQFNPRGQIKTTNAAVYLSGQMTQFIDATPGAMRGRCLSTV